MRIRNRKRSWASDPASSVGEASRVHLQNNNNKKRPSSCGVDEGWRSDGVVGNEGTTPDLLPITRWGDQRSSSIVNGGQDYCTNNPSASSSTHQGPPVPAGMLAGVGEAGAPDRSTHYRGCALASEINIINKNEEVNLNLSAATTSPPPSATSCDAAAPPISVVSSSSPPPKASHRRGVWWFKGEISFQFPLKKMRRSRPTATTINEDHNHHQQIGDNVSSSSGSGSDSNYDIGSEQLMTKKKKNKRDMQGNSNGSASPMEGSRCSRVNGRGWRCCQQTLVGYSLCEHHLGKGRLRSVSSVRSRRSAAANAASNDQSNLKNKDEEKALVMKKDKKKKIGMVKARSISSLLGQTNYVKQQPQQYHHQVPIHDASNDDHHHHVQHDQQPPSPLQPPCDDRAHDYYHS